MEEGLRDAFSRLNRHLGSRVAARTNCCAHAPRASRPISSGVSPQSHRKPSRKSCRAPRREERGKQSQTAIVESISRAQNKCSSHRRQSSDVAIEGRRPLLKWLSLKAAAGVAVTSARRKLASAIKALATLRLLETIALRASCDGERNILSTMACCG